MSLFHIVIALHCFILAPEAVTDIVYAVLTPSTIAVQWVEPSIPNGIITHYEVNLTVESYVTVSKNLTNNNIFISGNLFIKIVFTTLIDLEPYIPYVLSVAGYTVKGRGDINSTSVFFTFQGSMLLCYYTLYFLLISSSLWPSKYYCFMD